MVSNSDLERIIEDSIQPSTEYANSQIPPLKRSNIDLKIIETLGSSEIIINTLLDPKYQEFIKSGNPEELLEYSNFASLLKMFNGAHWYYHFLKNQGYPVIGENPHTENWLVDEESFKDFEGYMISRMEDQSNVDLHKLLKFTCVFHERNFPLIGEKAELYQRGASSFIPDNEEILPQIKKVESEDTIKILEDIVKSHPKLHKTITSMEFLGNIFSDAHNELYSKENTLLIYSIRTTIEEFEKAKSTFFNTSKQGKRDGEYFLEIEFHEEAYERFKEDYGSMVRLTLGDLQIFNSEFLKEYAVHLQHRFSAPNFPSQMSDENKIIYKTILRQKERLETLRERVFETLFKYDEYSFHSRKEKGKMTWDLTSLSDEWYSGIQAAQTFVNKGSRKVEEKPLEEMVDEYITNTNNDVVNVVDIGCGDGKKSIHILKYLRKNYPDIEARLHLIDTSEDMLDIARINAYDAKINPTTKIEDIKRAPINPILTEFFNSLLAGVGYTKNVEELVPRDQIFEKEGLLDTYQNDLSIGNLMLCLGNTIGNMSAPDLVIKNLIGSTRNPNRDMILFDYDIAKDPTIYEDQSFMVSFMENAGFDRDLFEYRVNESKNGINAEFIYIGEQPLVLSQESENRILETGFDFIDYLRKLNSSSEHKLPRKREMVIESGERILVATSGKFKPTEFEQKEFTCGGEDYKTFMRRYSTHHKMTKDGNTMYVLSATYGQIPSEVIDMTEIDDSFIEF